MTPVLSGALSFALIPAGVALVGAVIAIFRPPSPRVRTYVEHFAAGVVVAVAAAELLPTALRGRLPIPVAIGFGLGTLAMLLIAHFSEGAEGEADAALGLALPGRAGDSLAKGGAISMVAPVAVDVAIDGFLLGLAFVAGQKAGMRDTVVTQQRHRTLIVAGASQNKSQARRAKARRWYGRLGLYLIVAAASGSTM